MASRCIRVLRSATSHVCSRDCSHVRNTASCCSWDTASAPREPAWVLAKAAQSSAGPGSFTHPLKVGMHFCQTSGISNTSVAIVPCNTINQQSLKKCKTRFVRTSVLRNQMHEHCGHSLRQDSLLQ